jgi:signal transduction histidine kinase
MGIVKVSLTDKNISVILDLQCHAPLLSYPNELMQALLNLIKNAEDAILEHGSENPQIHIRTYHQKEHCILTVEDNGGGIPGEILEEIFDPYFSTKERKNGTGLGLYMSKTIIEEHCKGQLQVENTPRGARFTIDLEIAQEDLPLQRGEKSEV